MKTKIFSILLAIMEGSLSLYASNIKGKVDGIWYFFDSSTREATVTFDGDHYTYIHTKYTGSVVIPSSVTYNDTTYYVTSIGDDAFYLCYDLISVTIPNTVKNIGLFAFYGCKGLTSISIPDSVTSIGNYAFESCCSLTSITIPNSVTSIGVMAFGLVPNVVYGGSALGSPWGAKSINGYVDGYLVYSDASRTNLLACSSAATGSMEIPNSVTSIGDKAFYPCHGLTSITIPNSVTNIGTAAFRQCIQLSYISVDQYNQNYCDVDGVLFNIDKTILIRYPAGKSDKYYTIPKGVTNIGDYAFENSHNLTDITIPSSVIYIMNSAFFGDTLLSTINIPNSVTSIGNYAFASCYSLTSITIPYNVTSIGYEAFHSCEKMTTVTIFAKTPPVAENYAFSQTPLDTLYVPKGSVSLYRKAEGWQSFKTIRSIQADTTNVDATSIEPGVTFAEVAWPQVSGAYTYELVIKDANGNVVCTLTFNAQGQLTSIAFNAPARDNEAEQTQVAGFAFTVTGLEEGTTYNYSIIAKDDSGNVLKEDKGTFTTKSTQGLANPSAKLNGSHKLLRDGQILILRDDKTYTLTGQEVK